MRVGLPILANTAAFGAVLNLDRVLILWRRPDGERAAGLYTIALMGTSWSLDLAGRIVLVLYTSFQTTLGRSGDPAEVARQAARATEAQAPVLAAGQRGRLRGRAGLPGHADAALRRGAARRCGRSCRAWSCSGWPGPPGRLLIAIGRPYRLFLATMLGLGAGDRAAGDRGRSGGDRRRGVGDVDRVRGRLLARRARRGVPARRSADGPGSGTRRGCADARLVRGREPLVAAHLPDSRTAAGCCPARLLLVAAWMLAGLVALGPSTLGRAWTWPGLFFNGRV